MIATDLASAQKRYFRQVKAKDIYGARTAGLRLLEAGTPLQHIVEKVLSPTQVQVGELWERGAWTVADERAATNITVSTLKALTLVARSRPATRPRHIVVTCAEGDRHTLPAHMVAAVADLGTSRVTVLSPWLPVDEFAAVLSRGEVDLLALSCTMPSNLMGAARRIDAAHSLDIPVVVGGRAFGASMVRAHAVGADAWASQASDLLQPAPTLAGRRTEMPHEALQLETVEDGTFKRFHTRAIANYSGRKKTSVGNLAAPDNLVSLVRSTAAALLTKDTTILDEELAWLSRLPGGAPGVSATLARALAETVERRTPSASVMLQASAVRLEGRPFGDPAPSAP